MLAQYDISEITLDDSYADSHSDGVPLRAEDDDAEESDAVHVKFSPRGARHKRAIGGERTACGRSLAAMFVFDAEYVGELCEDCFTPYERSLAQPELVATNNRFHMRGTTKP